MSTDLLLEKYATIKKLHPVQVTPDTNENDDEIFKGKGGPKRVPRPADEPVNSDVNDDRLVHNTEDDFPEINESDYTLYHPTYSAAIQHAVAQAKKRGFDVDEDDYHTKVATGPKKPSQDKTNSFNIGLTKNGKPVKQHLHVQVYNKGGKTPYELNMYVESVELAEAFELLESGAFSPAMIKKLQAEYAKIDKIDPASGTYTRLTKFLDTLPKNHLEQLAGAKVKFVSPLALNRLNNYGKKQIKESLSKNSPVTFRGIKGTVVSMNESEFYFMPDGGKTGRYVLYEDADVTLEEVETLIEIGEAFMDDMKRIASGKKKYEQVRFKNGASIDVDVQTASIVLKLHEVLKGSNRTKFEENLEKGPFSFMKMVGFANMTFEKE